MEIIRDILIEAKKTISDRNNWTRFMYCGRFGLDMKERKSDDKKGCILQHLSMATEQVIPNAISPFIYIDAARDVIKESNNIHILLSDWNDDVATHSQVVEALENAIASVSAPSPKRVTVKEDAGPIPA